MPQPPPDRPVVSLPLSGPITLYESGEIRETLRAAIAEKKDLQIDLDASGPWDLAGLQLLVSLANSGQKAGLSVRLVHVPGVCREIAERAGLGDWLSSCTDSFG